MTLDYERLFVYNVNIKKGERYDYTGPRKLYKTICE